MNLRFLDFDYSEDDEGTATWDALAHVGAARLPELLHEVTAVLAWAHAEFGTARGPVELGGLWDYDLQCERAGQALLALRYDVPTASVQPALRLDADAHLGLALCISGAPAFAAAFAEHFELS